MDEGITAGDHRMRMSRVWAMPNGDTFHVPPIEKFVTRYLRGVSVDPFARNSTLATYTNDLNPATSAMYHLDAEEFLLEIAREGVNADTVIFDPPYSPRQISELYQQIGKAVGVEDTQNARLYKRVREAIRAILAPGATVLSFGWNSAGMGEGFEIEEIVIVAHGGAHNDTICMAEKLIQPRLELA